MLKLNDMLAFVLEIVSIILLTKWAYSIPSIMWQKFLLVAIVLTVFVIIWSNYFAPNAPNALNGIIRWLSEFLILFLPYLQFRNSNSKYIIIGGFVVAINLFIQANFGRADW